MATSGSVDFQLNSRSVVEAALRKLQVVDAEEAVPEGMASEALQALNLMLKTWGASGRLWLTTEGSVTLLASTATYALTGVRKVMDVRRRTGGLDTPITELSRQEYNDISNKAGVGLPNSWYFDPQRSTKTLYVWYVPNAAIAASTTLRYTYARFIEDCDALDNDPDVPQEWFEALVYGLARRLGPNHEKVGTPEYAEIKEASERLYAALTSIDQETASVFFQPA
jgi:hypothetical protein